MHLSMGRVKSDNNYICAKNAEDITFIVGEGEKLDLSAAQKLGFDKNSKVYCAEAVFGSSGVIFIPKEIYPAGFNLIDFNLIGRKNK